MTAGLDYTPASRQRAVNPLTAFWPSPVLTAFVHDDHPLQFLRAANGAGKTTAMAYKVAREAVDHPDTRYRIIGPTRAQVRAVIGRYLYKFLRPYLAPGSLWKPGTGWNRHGTIILDNGSTIEIRSYEDDSDAHAGEHELRMVLLDEPPPWDIFDENLGRADIIVMGFTAVGERTHLIPRYRKAIEGDEASPTEGRTEHATGWAQYVVSFMRENVPWYTARKYREKFNKHKGKPSEPQRLWAAWEGAAEDRKFGGWRAKFSISAAEIRRRLKGRNTITAIRYGIDYGTGTGKQCQYLVFVTGRGRHQRFYVVSEYIGGSNATLASMARAFLDALKTWIKGSLKGAAMMLASDRCGVRGDINSSGPLGQGVSLNRLLQAEIAKQLGMIDTPFQIGAPSKRGGSKDAREIAMNHAMLEGRWWVCDECPRAIRANLMYKGGDRDKLKDPVDAQGYSVGDLLLETDETDGADLGR